MLTFVLQDIHTCAHAHMCTRAHAYIRHIYIYMTILTGISQDSLEVTGKKPSGNFCAGGMFRNRRSP